MVDQTTREAEFAKYERAYSLNPNYKIKPTRREHSAQVLASCGVRGAYLDVGCGRGEMLTEAARLGFLPVMGTEIVPELIDGKTVVRAEAHALPFPDKSFDVVSMFDVIEHLVRGDDAAGCGELGRVARRHIVISANNLPSFNAAGDDLHINKRPYPEWQRLFERWFPGARVRRQPPVPKQKSVLWRIDLA